MKLNFLLVTPCISAFLLVILITSTTCEINSYSTYDVKQAIGNESDYARVLELSLLFFEAQRSGKLPQDNRIPWRGDSALNDRGLNGEDLTGGYYDGGDFVKSSFPVAFTTTVLAWGVISWPEAYEAAGQLDEIRKTIKWATDYFIKCHVSKNELYAQVGDFLIDNSFWGRPEESIISRRAYKIDVEHHGSDLAGETAAALAATSIVFRNVDPEYSAKCLQHASDLFEFANRYRGSYRDTVPDDYDYYNNTGYTDDLVWAAVWLFKATEENTYLKNAIHDYQFFKLNQRPDTFFSDNKIAGIQVLLAELTEHIMSQSFSWSSTSNSASNIYWPSDTYHRAILAFCNFSAREQIRTVKGLLYLDEFGTLSHAANIAFICLKAADLPETDKHCQREYRQFAKQQIDYMLGGSGRSYVVGYGKDPPTQAYHAAASCPDRPAPCGLLELEIHEPNPHILYGALVSGPDVADQFHDWREECEYTDVELEYNAGFTGALAGLLQLRLKDYCR